MFSEVFSCLHILFPSRCSFLCFFFFFGPGFMSGLLKADRQLSICPVFGRVSVTGGSVETFLWVCWVFTVDSDS